MQANIQENVNPERAPAGRPPSRCGPFSKRKPTRYPMPMTSTTSSRFFKRSDVVRPPTPPTEPSGDRNRSMMPVLRSSARPGGGGRAEDGVLHEDARHQELHVLEAGRQGRELVRVDVAEQQHEHDRLHELEDEDGRARVQVPPRHQQTVGDARATRPPRPDGPVGRSGSARSRSYVLLRGSAALPPTATRRLVVGFRTVLGPSDP